jgi:hypothetical protein
VNFVVGHPRSGTALVAQILNAGGASHCRHEYLVKLSSMCVTLPTDYYAGTASSEAVHRLLEHYEYSPTPWVTVDSNWKLAWILPVLLERYPESRVVHLTRHPSENVRSCYNLDFYGSSHERPAFARRGFWLSAMPHIRRPDWDELSQFERNCAFWAETHRLIGAALTPSVRSRKVRLEDLQADGVLCDLFDFLKLPRPRWVHRRISARRSTNLKVAIKRRLEQAGAEQLGDPAAWPARYREQLRSICGERALELGYRL